MSSNSPASGLGDVQPGKSRRIELVVMSRPALDSHITPGHIMVAVSIAGIGEQAWGFYPDGVKDEIVKGGWNRYTSSVVIPINSVQYRALLKAIDQYAANNTYSLMSTNCRDFVMTVLRSAGIEVPANKLWPNDEGKQFMKLYGEGWGSCLAE